MAGALGSAGGRGARGGTSVTYGYLRLPTITQGHLRLPTVAYVAYGCLRLPTVTYCGARHLGSRGGDVTHLVRLIREDEGCNYKRFPAVTRPFHVTPPGMP